MRVENEPRRSIVAALNTAVRWRRESSRPGGGRPPPDARPAQARPVQDLGRRAPGHECHAGRHIGMSRAPVLATTLDSRGRAALSAGACRPPAADRTSPRPAGSGEPDPPPKPPFPFGWPPRRRAIFRIPPAVPPRGSVAAWQRPQRGRASRTRRFESGTGAAGGLHRRDTGRARWTS